jgi:hypothetical protein
MRGLLVTTIGLALTVPCAQAKKQEDFPLTIHITEIDARQGIHSVSGSGRTDSNGNYSSDVSGGGSYTYHVFTVRIDGDPKIYQFSASTHFTKKETALAVATDGVSLLAKHRAALLGIGDYHAHWNKNGTLEVQYINDKGKPTSEVFSMLSERLPDSASATN